MTTLKLTPEEYALMSTYVHMCCDSFDKTEKIVTIKIVYNNEHEIFLTTRIRKNDEASTHWYIDRAFDQSKKDIVQWVKQTHKHGIVGSQYSFSMEYYND